MTSESVYVLDISVLLSDPEAIFGFPEKEVILPLCIFEALDIIKMELGEKGRKAQMVSQILDRCSQNGSLVDGVCLLFATCSIAPPFVDTKFNELLLVDVVVIDMSVLFKVFNDSTPIPPSYL